MCPALRSRSRLPERPLGLRFTQLTFHSSTLVAVVKSRALTAARAMEVTVEVHLADGLPCFAIVALADTKVRKSRERVRAAIQNSGFEFPARPLPILPRPTC